MYTIGNNNLINNNYIKWNSAGGAEKRWGVYVTGDKNSISNNVIDMVNNTGSDIGIFGHSNADNNYGRDNFILNAGTGIDLSAGSGNDVTATYG